MKHLPYHSALLAASLLVAPSIGFAESQPIDVAAAGAATTSTALDEVIVTARRQAENVLNVPASIQATSGDDLRKNGLRDLRSLQFTTPGYFASDAAGAVQVFVRGVGNATFFADPSVPVFVDDVPRVFGFTAGNLVNVARVELLKGAQGGLYGRNATGGVLNIVTRQPSDKFEGVVNLSYGEKKTFQGSAYINIPLSGQIALNASIQRDSHDYYVKNITTNTAPYTAAMFPSGGVGGRLPAATVAALLNQGVHVDPGVGNQDYWAYDAKLLIKPTENFKITFAGDYGHKKDNNGHQFYLTTPGFVQAVVAGTLASTGTPAVLPPGFIQATNEKFTTARGAHPFINLRDYGGSATAVWSTPAEVDLTSITGYRRQIQRSLIDATGSSVPFANSLGNNKRYVFYQELRAISTKAGPLHWLGGGSYLQAGQTTNSQTQVLPNFLAALSPQVTTSAKTRVKNWSVYGQAGYDFTDSLTLTGSLRYVKETTTTVFSSPNTSRASISEDKILPSVSLSYKLPGEGVIYGRWARGFKAGGTNYAIPPSLFPTDLGKVFHGETVDTYEIGAHAALLDGKMNVSTAIFYNDYKGLQYSGHGAPTNPQLSIAPVNAKSARTYGIEGSVAWRVIPAVTLGVNAGYLNAKYKDFEIGPGTPIAAFNFNGFTMINSPKLQVSFSANLDQPINDRFNLIGSILETHTSSVVWGYTTTVGVSDARSPSYWTTNARLGIKTRNDRYEFAVAATNLFNAANYTFGSTSSAGAIIGWGSPRIVRAELKANF